jgi:hypothetical protein
MTEHTIKAGEDAAREMLAGDWDAAGTTSVHLPREQGMRLLEVRGWYIGSNGEWLSPSGSSYWHTDEALTVALLAEAL